jgi:hypothetical protein
MKLILADHPDIPPAQLEEASQVVIFNKEAYSKVDMKNVAVDSDYQPNKIATDEEFDTLREWLKGHFFMMELILVRLFRIRLSICLDTKFLDKLKQ